MVFFYIAAPQLFGSRDGTVKQIHQLVIRPKVAWGKQLTIDRSKFKMANLDTLMFCNDKVLKLQSNIQGFLKKLDKQYCDLQQKQQHDWFIRGIDRQIAAKRYYSEFRWSESKYPCSYAIPKIVELFENKLHTVENELRIKSVAYNDTKVQLSQATQKEGNYNVKDLNDVIVPPYVSNNDFKYSKFVTTVVCIVPTSSIDQFKRKYHFLTDNVFPYSAKRLNIPEKDNLTLWTVNLFTQKLEQQRDFGEDVNPNKKKEKRHTTPVSEFIDKARDELKIIVREFKFESGISNERRRKKEALEYKINELTKQISDICLAYFSEIYELYIHTKMLRVVIESSMRFGSDRTVIYCIEPAEGKEKTVQTLLVEIFGDKQSEGLYGTKEEIDDGQDFFPFIYVPGLTF